MRQNQRIILGCVAATLAIVGFLLWFNRYSFSEMKYGDNTYPVRTSRFTGESEFFTPLGWTKLGGASAVSSPSETKPFALPPGDIAKIDGRAGIRNHQYAGEMPKYFLNCSAYNGTGVSIAELTVRLEITETNNQKALARDFRLRPKDGGVVAPQSNGDFEGSIGLQPKPGTWSWRIVGASGVR